ncbi:hypothetical protein QFC19_004544 [Naganishia cerealis]|uniref:Uncharacterized protein n=1 Tax=Naganishia cerealis TaxID=610337 RepID=A0ACC2VVQ7_9TREE|nr:hypothetical protein QFC19_004544 [Naganishia cerealis]
MQLSLERIQQLSQQYLSYLQHRRLVGRAAAPHPPTNAESRKLQTWIALFFMSGQMASGLAEYLRKESRDRRTQRMTQVYRGYMHGVDAVMNEDLLAQARSLLPDFDQLNATSPIDPSEHAFPLASDDVKAIQLVKWFKHDFMHWVDPIKCPSCAGDTTHQSSSGHESMTAEERQVAGRLEVWKCNDSDCGGIDRFLRLNDLSALLKSRRGRCGEFANLFTLFLHAAALQWRIVVNAEDHVWNEYWSASAQRWIHMDPSEGSADQPLVYDLGWGKKQSYCIAFGPTGGKDVTRGYVSDWEDVGGCQERRTLWMEDDLNDMIKRFTDERRSKLQLHQAPWLPSVNELEHQDVKEEDYLADYRKRVADAKKHAFDGRSSGTLDWRAQRKEIGGGASAEEVIPIDIDMSSSLADLCLYGSADIRASDENEENTVLSLTPLETDKTGSAFLVTDLAASDSYVADITFRIRKRKGQEGADGMGVATMSVPSEELSLYREAGGQVRVMGDGGAGLGYTGLGTPDDFAIEIDTYRRSALAFFCCAYVH